MQGKKGKRKGHRPQEATGVSHTETIRLDPRPLAMTQLLTNHAQTRGAIHFCLRTMSPVLTENSRHCIPSHDLFSSQQNTSIHLP